MTTHKQRMLAAARGDLSDLIPYVPRIDLWYNANSVSGTLPKQHQGRAQDEISRAEGWALHKVIPEFLAAEVPEDNLHRVLGIYDLKEYPFRHVLPKDVEVEVKKEADVTQVTYHTPLGTASAASLYDEEMRKAGVSITWIKERILKRPEDYRAVGYIFENLEILPAFDKYSRWKDCIGEDGVACAVGNLSASPMQHIQRDFLEATDFFYHYHDYPREMRDLAQRIELYFEKILAIMVEAPAEFIVWGTNYDDMITYPEYFKKEILPWLQRATNVLGSAGKHVLSHCDGENLGLMDLIRDSGIHLAEAICPYPMTKVRVEEYYRAWGDKLTLWGGIPSNLLLAESTSDENFEAYLDHLFKSIGDGRRMIFGIADTTPPNAVYERLLRIGDRVEKEARPPLAGSVTFGVPQSKAGKPVQRAEEKRETLEAAYMEIQKDVLQGRHEDILKHVQELLDQEVSALDIVQKGMISAMLLISEDFRKGTVFIPEVLLSARTMNRAVEFLEPHLVAGPRTSAGKILIGTVHGDLHDIGKNLVAAMWRGVGFNVIDIGINVPTDDFIRQIKEHEPDIVGMSALLTTTMPEMRRVIEAMVATGIRDRVKVVVGGAPVNERFAKGIGADGYARDAGEAVEVVARLLSHGT
jgi:methylmalonyl-CoA mutase cobalamin-binding domain/chain